MSKGTNSSYEGFRRKNSLNSIDTHNNSSATDLTSLRFRHNEHLSEVENLSMQLEGLTKRSLSSRSFCQEKQKLSRSSNNINDFEEGVTQNRFFHPLRKEEAIPLKKVEYYQEGQKAVYKERKEKVSNSAIFNKFQVIEEDHYQNEEEDMEGEIEPVTFKANPAKVPEKKTARTVHIKAVTMQPQLAKKPVVLKMQNAGVKKEKIKLQLKELDKMQKELDSKRNVREVNTSKTTNSLQRGKDATISLNLKESGKMGKTISQPSTERAKQSKSSANILLTTKMTQSKHEACQQAREECIPTRMLSQKEKTLLIMRVEGLREIIEKNDICSENLEEISAYFKKIEKLLTR